MRDHDSPVAEDTIYPFFGKPGFLPGFLLEPYHFMFDKGKPVQRRGRKAMGLQFRAAGS